MAKDPYKLLNVPKSASESDIRKAYRKLAKELHPDVKPNDPVAADRFKEISAAYTLLSDKGLREQYDSGQVDGSGQRTNPFGGMGGGGRGGMGGGFQRASRGTHPSEMEDLFSSLFGMNTHGRGRSNGGPFGGGYQRQAPRPQKGADVRYKVSIRFQEALKGGSRKLTGSDGAMITVKIPEGIKDGQALRVRGKGRPGVNGAPSGDAIIDVKVKAHKYFSRIENDIWLTLPISLQEAVLGAKIIVPMPMGGVQVRIPTGSNSGTVLRVKGKGVKGKDVKRKGIKAKRDDGKQDEDGDLYLTLQIKLEDPKSADLVQWAKQSQSNSEYDPREKLLD